MPAATTTRLVSAILVLLGSALGIVAQESAAPVLSAVSPRNASYTIDVKLDIERHMLVGRQTLVWRNIQEQPTDELWFHLYWNAWRNDRSTWMLQGRLNRRGRNRDKTRPDDWGYIEVDSIRAMPDSRPGTKAPGSGLESYVPEVCPGHSSFATRSASTNAPTPSSWP